MKELTLSRCGRCGEKAKIEKVGKTNTGRTIWRVTWCGNSIISPIKSYILYCMRETERKKRTRSALTLTGPKQIIYLHYIKFKTKMEGGNKHGGI